MSKHTEKEITPICAKLIVPLVEDIAEAKKITASQACAEIGIDETEYHEAKELLEKAEKEPDGEIPGLLFSCSAFARLSD